MSAVSRLKSNVFKQYSSLWQYCIIVKNCACQCYSHPCVIKNCYFKCYQTHASCVSIKDCYFIVIQTIVIIVFFWLSFFILMTYIISVYQLNIAKDAIYPWVSLKLLWLQFIHGSAQHCCGCNLSMDQLIVIIHCYNPQFSTYGLV